MFLLVSFMSFTSLMQSHVRLSCFSRKTTNGSPDAPKVRYAEHRKQLLLAAAPHRTAVVSIVSSILPPLPEFVEGEGGKLQGNQTHLL